MSSTNLLIPPCQGHEMEACHIEHRQPFWTVTNAEREVLGPNLSELSRLRKTNVDKPKTRTYKSSKLKFEREH